MVESASPETRSVACAGVSFDVSLPRKLDRDYWAKVEAGRWEPETFRLFRALLDARALGRATRLVDIGAWIGPTALYAAALGAEVTAFEPDPAALSVLRANLALNPALAARVRVEPTALDATGGDADGCVTLASEEPGNSMSGLFRDAPERIRVPAATPGAAGLERLFATADLVKLDIEGGEFALLPALAAILAAHRPVMHLSLHARFLPETRFARGERRRLQQEALAALPTYAHGYWAERGVWRALDDPRTDLARRLEGEAAGGRGLDGSIVLSDRTIPELTA
ncbi:MAG: FkbM family methyltransferase [Marivibrio sp.]|uniref:FkbM family methyltransferase n=1 Tax=Marivibrio sp. TaxID=2039719 RepID=UPI0032EB04DD